MTDADEYRAICGWVTRHGWLNAVMSERARQLLIRMEARELTLQRLLSGVYDLTDALMKAVRLTPTLPIGDALNTIDMARYLAAQSRESPLLNGSATEQEIARRLDSEVELRYAFEMGRLYERDAQNRNPPFDKNKLRSDYLQRYEKDFFNYGTCASCGGPIEPGAPFFQSAEGSERAHQHCPATNVGS